MIYKNGVLERESWILEMDLKFDLCSWAYNELVKMGYKEVEFENALHLYLNAKKRSIPSRPRKVHKSKEFRCPESYEKALANFENKVVEGKSLIPFLSKKVEEASYNDGLLNDWNIQHFHLTNRFNKEGWAKRSDYEIFAFVTDFDMYFIQIYPHNKPFLYSQQEMIRIIYENWPNLIEKYRIEGVSSLQEDFSDEEYNSLRAANISTFVDIGEGNVFGLFGGGYNSDGSSTEVVRTDIYLNNQLKQTQKMIIDNMSVLRNLIEKVSEKDMHNYKVKLLYLKSNEITMCEINHKVIIQLNLEEQYWRVCKPIDIFRS